MEKKKSILLAAVAGSMLMTFQPAKAANVGSWTDLQQAIVNGTTAIDITGDITAEGNLGTLGGSNNTVTINGGGNDINGSGHQGITVNSGQTLNVNNVGNSTDENSKGFNGFSSYSNGAIYNRGTTSITDSTFTGNRTSYGGAIYNRSTATITITDSTFTGNEANYSGGAIYNYGTATITGSTFTGNSASQLGGAIYNSGAATIIITGSTFTGNEANSSGGAISNYGTATITDSTFTGNRANSSGGAIYNNGTANIIANESDTTFTGNTAGGVSNALYNSSYATTNLNAADGHKIVFNDGIDGDSSGTININNTGVKMADGTTDAPTSGVVEFNNTVKSHTVNLYNGTLKLGHYEGGTIDVNGTQQTVSKSVGSLNSSVDFVVNGGKLSVESDGTTTQNLGNVTLNTDLSTEIALNTIGSNSLLSADSVTSNNDSKIVISDINLGSTEGFLSNKVITKDTDILKNITISEDVTISGTNLEGKNTLLGYTMDDTRLALSAGVSTLQQAVADSTANRIYTMNTNENVASDLGTMGGGSGATLTIKGNGHDINGSGHQGIRVNSGQTLNVNNVGNSTDENSKGFNGFSSSQGGVIYNRGTATITGSTYTGNSANSQGGAIYNYDTAAITGSTFTGNEAVEGGAIFNWGTATITGSTFTGNEANYGGAISNGGTAATITGSTFTGNSASQLGGAIYNGVTATITDSTFTGNSANSRGGAIYNYGTANIIANESDTTFTGNTAGGVSNALYNSSYATTNLNAADGHKIVFNDGIDGDSSGTININNTGVKMADGTTDAPTSGVVEFNNTVKSHTVNLYNGTLKLGHYEGGTIDVNGTQQTVSESFGSLDSSVNFNVHGGTLSLQDGGARTTNLGNVTLENDLQLAIDADLANSKSDMITGNLVKANDNNIVISDVNILSDSTVSILETQVADDNLKSVVELATDAQISKAAGVKKNYLLSYDNTDGMLEFNSIVDLKAAVDATDSSRVYNMSTDENVTQNLGTMGGTNSTLTINGGGNDINGNGHKGITVNSGQTLNVNNVGNSTDEDSKGFNGFSSSKGGAIYNDRGTATITGSTFTGNEANYGGAIYNSDTATITDSTFTGNMANYNGGAIYNDRGTATITGSTFTGNEAKSGGAISNYGTATITGSTFTGNEASGSGGAISNWSTATITGSTFTGNEANYYGGAIYNSGTAAITGSTFTGNKVKYGGAIYNDRGTATITGSTFTGNEANYSGGAIYNCGTANIIANESDTTFTGNTAGGVSNALYNYWGRANLNAADGHKIVFNDGIDGDSYSIANNIININNSNVQIGIDADNNPIYAGTDGTVEINNTVKNNTVNLYNGTLKLGHYEGGEVNGKTVAESFGSLDSSVNFIVHGGTLSLQDGAIQNTNLGNLTLNSDLDLRLDGNFAQNQLDTISANKFNANGNNINISNILILEPTTEKSFSISPLGTGMDDSVRSALAGAIQYTGGDIAYSPIYKYSASYDPATAMMNFGLYGGGGGGGGGDTPGYESFNPAVMASPVAAQLGGYLVQLNAYDNAFRNMDMYMLMTKEQRQAMKMRNRYATTNKDIVFDPTVTMYENKAGWFRPYATFENVSLNNGPKVSNVAYGSFFGAESELYDLGHGWDGMWGVYGGYNGSHQAYDGVSIYQNGGTFGAVGMAYKGNFFTGLTANVGASAGEASSMFGHEDFAMLMSGVASKTGYNWELANGKFIIQPSLLMSYSFINTFDYRNAAGVSIDSDPLHAIQLEPGIKFIGNLKNGWQPYLGVSVVWNIMDRTHFQANNVALPNLSIDPFVKYGVGVRKSWGERFTGFFQTYITNGGRNGVGLQAGFRWTLGKSEQKQQKANQTPELPKAKITLKGNK